MPTSYDRSDGSQEDFAEWISFASRVAILFYGKGPGKSQVTVDHMKLASSNESAKMKSYWFEALNRLQRVLGA